jgi:hypothetical protein
MTLTNVLKALLFLFSSSEFQENSRLMEKTYLSLEVYVQGIPLLGSDGMSAREERRNKVANVARYLVHL